MPLSHPLPQTVLVAGATGYLGRHICTEYRRRQPPNQRTRFDAFLNRTTPPREGEVMTTITKEGRIWCARGESAIVVQEAS